MHTLWSSRAFWTAVVDAAVGIIFLVVGTLYPQHMDLMVKMWALLQPIVVAIIAAYTTDELAQKIVRLL